jgi:CRP/FNR family cyclic AMP-dependent transcriptional regulator
MAVIVSNETLKKIHFFRGLRDEELELLAALCDEQKYALGELVQKENEPSTRVNFILEGSVGAVVHMPGISYGNKELIIDTLKPGDAFGWSALIYGAPWSTLRAIEPARVLYANASDLLKLCEDNNHIGYILMKNLATLISSRLKRNRVSTLNAIAAMRGEG